ncbi:MAG: hypothetical protein VX498_13540, partial [Myxococcota bacterium]|nr:hypothetical protein [Myxococcota bacterium]
MHRVLSFIQGATVDQWRALEDEHAARPAATSGQKLAVLGLYVLALLVLISVEYFAKPSYSLVLKDHIPPGSRRFVGKVWWCWFVVGAYVVPTALYCRFVQGLSLRD